MTKYTLFIGAFVLVLTGAGCSLDTSVFDDTDDVGEEKVFEIEDVGTDLSEYEVPDGLVATVDTSTRVNVGDAFQITATIANDTSEDQFLHSIDVAQDYLEGSVILSTNPIYSDAFPIGDGTVTHFFEQDIAAGEVLTVTFELEALTAGDYSGTFDVCYDEGFTCSFLQIRTIVE